MNYTGIARRDEYLQFIKLNGMEKHFVLGVGVEDTGKSFNPDEASYKWVTMKSPITTVRSYGVTQDVEAIVHKDDPVFKALFEIMRKQATGEKASGSLIDAYVLEGEGDAPTSCPADLTDISVTLQEFGGGEDLSISVTINFNGSPVEGTATIDYEEKSATFSETGA